MTVTIAQKGTDTAPSIFVNGLPLTRTPPPTKVDGSPVSLATAVDKAKQAGLDDKRDGHDMGPNDAEGIKEPVDEHNTQDDKANDDEEGRNENQKGPCIINAPDVACVTDNTASKKGATEEGPLEQNESTTLAAADLKRGTVPTKSAGGTVLSIEAELDMAAAAMEAALGAFRVEMVYIRNVKHAAHLERNSKATEKKGYKAAARTILYNLCKVLLCISATYSADYLHSISQHAVKTNDLAQLSASAYHAVWLNLLSTMMNIIAGMCFLDMVGHVLLHTITRPQRSSLLRDTFNYFLFGTFGFLFASAALGLWRGISSFLLLAGLVLATSDSIAVHAYDYVRAVTLG